MEKEVQAKSPCRLQILAALLCALCAAGCQRWRLPDDMAALQVKTPGQAPGQASKPPKRGEETKETYAWYESTKLQRSSSQFQWRNDRLEEISQDPSGAAELESFVAQGDSEKSSGAIIQLSRMAPGARDAELERIAGSKSQPKTTRLAAIETLGKSPQGAATDRLIRLGKKFEDELPPEAAVASKPIDDDRYLSGVLAALTERNVDLAPFEKNLSPRGACLTCVALIADLQQRGKGPAAVNALRCFEHPQPAVRMALLRWVAAACDAEATGEVLKITRGGQGEVYFEAIKTLGALPSSKSVARLDELTRDARPRVSGAAFAALIRQESPTISISALSESRWQVKQAVAEFLAEPVSDLQWSFAEAMLLDPAPAVQQTLTRTLAQWSAESSQRAALIGLESPIPSIRQSYWSMLSEGRAHLGEFDPSAPEERRKMQLARIRDALNASPRIPQAETEARALSSEHLRRELELWRRDDETDRKLAELRLVSLGGELITALDALEPEELRGLSPAFWKSTVGVVDPRFAAANRLRSSDIEERRDAARSLAGLQGAAAPPLALLIWLEPLLAPEEDLFVWRQLLPIVSRAGDAKSRSAAARIAMDALKIETLDVRVTACGILENAEPRDEVILALEPLLESKSQSEIIAAIGVLKRCEPLPLSIQEKLAALLNATEGPVRIEAGFVLSKLGDGLATKLLTSSAITGPETDRRLAIERLGDTKSRSHLPLLIGLLDASPTLRQAAIAAIEKVAQEEVIAVEEKPFMSTAEQASRWKTWYAEQKMR